MDVVRQPSQGWIEVIVGSMFSGKSEELIRRLRRAQIARQRVQIFKPAIDDRFAADQIVSHSEMRIPSLAVRTARELIEAVAAETEVIGIDEGQFFDLELPMVCDTLANQGKRVIIAGLDQDYLGKPFEPMPQLLAIAEYITKTHAICMVCGNPANHTQRLVASGDRVLVGAQGVYEARCRVCFDPLLAGSPEPSAETNSKSQIPNSKSQIPSPKSQQPS
jgi:thymidine kinase